MQAPPLKISISKVTFIQFNLRSHQNRVGVIPGKLIFSQYNRVFLFKISSQMQIICMLSTQQDFSLVTLLLQFLFS